MPSAAASISKGCAKGASRVRANRRRTPVPRCGQARHQIVERVAVRPNRVSGKLFGSIRHEFSLLLAAHRRRAHYQALRIMPRFVRRFRRHLRRLQYRFGKFPHRRGKQLPLCFRHVQGGAVCGGCQKNRPHSTGCGHRCITNRPSAI